MDGHKSVLIERQTEFGGKELYVDRYTAERQVLYCI